MTSRIRTRMRLCIVALLFTSGLGAGQKAAAQSRTAVVIVWAEESAEDALRAGAMQALAEQGVRPLPVPIGIACEEVESCAQRWSSERGADIGVVVRLSESRLEVLRHLSGGTTDRLQRTVDDSSDLRQMALRALSELLAERASSSEGWLLILPEGESARVQIDNLAPMRAPLRRRLNAGRHRVRELDTERSHTIDVEEAEEFILDLGDEEEEDGPLGTGPSSSAEMASEWNWVLSGALAIASIGVVISPLSTLATEGECTVFEGDACVEEVRFGLQSGLLLGTGIALLAAAFVIELAAPIRIRVEASGERAQVFVAGRF